MKDIQPRISRRDFMKLGGATALALFLKQTGIAKALGDENLRNVEGIGLSENQFYMPQNTSILLLPIGKDGFYLDFGDKAKRPVSLSLTGGVTFQAKNVQTVKVNGLDLKVAEIPFAGGDLPGVHDLGIPANTDQYLAMAVVEAGGKAFYKKYSDTEVLAGYTGIWKESFYPSKLWNILVAAKNIAEFQEAHDGFSDGSYSFMDIQKHLSDPNFKRGYNFSWNLVNGAGIDAAAAVLSKSLFPLTQTGKAAYTGRSSNPEYFEYFQGPTGPEITEENSDAKIQIDSNGSVRSDFSWKFSGVGKVYLNIGVNIVPDGMNWSKGSWTKLPGDRLVLSMYWSKNRPALKQSEAIGKIMTAYGKSRDAGPGTVEWGELVDNGSEYSTVWSEALKISESVRPEQNIRDFMHEIVGADKGLAKVNIAAFLSELQKSGKQIKDMDPGKVQEFYYSFIYYVRDLTNEFNDAFPYTAADEKAKRPRPSQQLGTILVSKMAEDGILWPFVKAVPGFQGAVSELNNNTYLRGDQSIQCLVWVSFLGRLGLPVSPLYIGGTSSATASGLVTDFVRNSLKYVDFAADPKHAELRFARPHKIENVQVGDSFVRWGGDNNHIGTVIGKKTVGGEVRLLITDANRKNDGVIRIFEVTKDNFRLVFGNDAEDLFPIVIRNESVEKFLAKSSNPLEFLFRVGGR